MKSRTSFFNPTVFKKDLRRFAPAWVLYLVCLLLGVTVILADSGDAYYRANAVAGIIPLMALVNIAYAFVNAQLLFGDLHNARLCNALHAMPLRRECWYMTHLAAGLAFSAVPNVLGTLVGLLLANIGIAWPVALWWCLASTLQYLSFFGIAVFCMMLCGNRFAATLIYGIINFFSLLVYWLANTLYEPLLPGIRFSEKDFSLLSPLVQLLAQEDLVEIVADGIFDELGDFVRNNITGLSLGNWWPLVCYALFGAALLVLGLVMYRRRDLETAGDFTAFKFAEPVLLVIYTVTAGGFLHLFSDLFGTAISYLFLVVGLAAGFFTGLMLLQRTTRVFRPRAFVQFGVLMGVFVLSLLITWADPLGITRWVPDAEEVAKVNLSTRTELHYSAQYDMDLTETADIQNLITVHQEAIKYDTVEEREAPYGEVSIYTINVCIEYTMKDGSVRTRFYFVPVKSEPGQILRPYFSSLEYLLGITEEEIPQFAKRIDYVYSNGVRDNTTDQEELMAKLDTEAMLRAIAADCAAGNLAQNSYYYRDNPEELWREAYLEFQVRLEDKKPGRMEWHSLQISREAVNTLKWMEENGLYDPDAEPFG